MGLKRSKPQRRVPDSVDRLWSFLETRRDAWRAANASIERRDVAAVDGTRWTIFRKIHANRIKGARAEKLDFRASITIWPGATVKSTGLARSDDTPAVQGWRRQVERKVRRQGYRGGWRRSPWGPHGDFWKTLRNARAVRAEVKLLDNLRL